MIGVEKLPLLSAWTLAAGLPPTELKNICMVSAAPQPPPEAVSVDPGWPLKESRVIYEDAEAVAAPRGDRTRSERTTKKRLKAVLDEVIERKYCI